MNRLDVFLSNRYDNKVALLDNEKAITYAELKRFISFKITEFKTNPQKNIILFSTNNFEFIIDFWAAIFAQKTIYLLSDIKKLEKLDIPYFLSEKKYCQSDINLDLKTIENTDIKFFTSGSTGTPKLIEKDLQVVLNEAFDVLETFSAYFEDAPVFLTTSLPTHLFVFTFYFLIPFCGAFSINSTRIQYPEQLEKLHHSNNILITSPAFLNSLKKYDVLMSNVVTVFSAGSKLDNSSQVYFEKQGLNVIDIWGSTETGVIAHRVSSNEGNYTSFPNVQIIPMDQKTCIKATYFLENKMIINDKIELISNEKFKLLGRTDRLVKINDKRVSLIELENNLLNCEYIQDVYCLEYDKKLCSAVVLSQKGKEFYLSNGAVKTKKTLKKYLFEYSDITPEKWIFLPELPMNERGKIDSNNLKKLLGTKISLPFVLHTEIEKNFVNINMIFPLTSNFLEGHFKIAPIVPGVVQLYFARKFAQDFFKEDIIIWQIKRIKFSNVILPEKKIVLKLKNTENSITFEYISETGELLSSGSFAKLKGQ